jgi:DNA-binding transcriptional MerR regulator
MALTIGDLGKTTRTKVETIRYYERIGLLPEPPRTSGNYRDYGQCELGRLSFIRRARDLGFSLDQVRALLGLSDDRTRDCGISTGSPRRICGRWTGSSPTLWHCDAS